jgi:hypothetical protein
MELQACEDFALATKEHDTDSKANQIMTKAAEAQALAKAKKKGNAADVVAILSNPELEPPEAPKRVRYIVNNATIERLEEILSENPMGVMQFRDELTGWLKSMGKEGREQDGAWWIECWPGHKRTATDRIARGHTPCNQTVSVLGGIQPATFQLYLIEHQASGGGDGLLERLQLMVYPDRPDFHHVDRKPNGHAREQATKIFAKFAVIPDSEDEMPSLRFSAEVQVVFNKWYCQLKQRLQSGDCSAHMDSHLAK